jgi:CheY-like chemotaxis protein
MNKKIAYVETDSDLLFLVKLSLENHSYLVRTYDSGQRFLDDLAYQPDLILLDVCMPELDGVTLFLKIKEQPSLQNVPVFFFTAKIAPRDIEHYNKIGVEKVISKPINPCKLAKIIETFWQE